jgi:hypothetical protein
VILVGCDLRKPSLSRQLVPDGTEELIDVITNKASLDEVISSDPSTRLSFLPAGVKSRLTHTSVGVQPRRQVALRHELDPEPALCGHAGGNRLGLDAASSGLHRIRASVQDPW